MLKKVRNYVLKEYTTEGAKIQKSDSFPARSLAGAKQTATKMQKFKNSTLKVYNLGRLVATRTGAKWEEF